MGAKLKPNLLGKKKKKDPCNTCNSLLAEELNNFLMIILAFCVERTTSQGGGRSGCCSHVAMQPWITREAFVGGQHIITLQ